MGGICRPQTGWQRCSEILPSASLDGGLVNHLRAGAANARESRGCVRMPHDSRGFDKITASLQKTPRIVAKLPIQRCPNESCPQTPPKERQTFCKIWLYIKQSWCESVLMRQREKKKKKKAAHSTLEGKKQQQQSQNSETAAGTRNYPNQLLLETARGGSLVSHVFFRCRQQGVLRCSRQNLEQLSGVLNGREGGRKSGWIRLEALAPFP